jgi:hypothetical protein
MISRVKIKRGQIEDFISQSTEQYINDVLAGNISVLGYNHTDWDTAFSWGNHAEFGYITGITVTDTNSNPITHDIATVEGTIIKETVTQLNQPYLDGNNLVLKFQNENDIEQTVSVDLSNIVTNNSGINNATYNASTNVITLTEEDGDVWQIDLSEFSIITNTDAQGVTTLAQENTVKLTVSKAGQSGDYYDLLNIPDTISGISFQDALGVEQFFINDFVRFDGVDFDVANQKISVIQQTLNFNKYTGDLIISNGNTVNLDDRYSTNPKGLRGEMYYINEHGTNNLTADYPLKRGIVVENQEEFDAATFTGFTLEEVFNHWDMFSHYYGNGEAEQSPPTFPALNESDPQESTRLTADEFYNKTAWGYDSVNDRIYLSKNYHPYTGFISPRAYDDYTLEATFSSPNGDDDWMGLVIGFYKDPVTGFEHTLSVFRMLVEHSGQGNTTYTVEYNHGQNPPSHADYNPDYADNSQKIIVDATDLAPFISGGWNQNTTRVKVVRTGDVFSIKTSQFKSTTIDDTTEIILDLNDHPELAIFKTESRIGFSARSQMDAYFSDIVFTGFTDYIFWPTSETTYDTYEYNQTTQQYELQSPKTTSVIDYFGISRFVYSYLFEKTYYVTENDTLVQIGSSTDITKTSQLENDSGYITGFDIQDPNGNTLFNVTDYLRIEGLAIDINEKKITANPLTAYTIFIDTVNGSDATGEKYNSERPYKTFEAAYQNTPDDGRHWVYHFIDDGVTRTITQDFTRDTGFTIYCETDGTFILDNADSMVGQREGLVINIPNAVFRFQGIQRFIGASYAGWVRLDCETLEMRTNNPGHSSTWSAYDAAQYTGVPLSWIRCDNLDWDITTAHNYGGLFNFTGDLTVRRKMTVNNGFHRVVGNGGNTGFTIDINHIEYNSTSSFFSGYFPSKFKISKVSGTNTLKLGSYQNNPMILELDNFDVDTTNGTGGLQLPTTRRNYLTVTGNVRNPNGTYINLGSNDTNGTLKLTNFNGPVERISAYSKGVWEIENTTLNFADYLFYGSTNPNLGSPFSGTMTFIGAVTLSSDMETPTVLASQVYHPMTVLVKGYLTTNCKGWGRNITAQYPTPSFKEKDKEIVVRHKEDLVNRELRSDVSYLIDGDIALSAGESIIIPQDGLTIMGYSFDASRLGSYGVDGHSIFVSEGDYTIVDETGNHNSNLGLKYKPIFNAPGLSETQNSIYLDGVSSLFRPGNNLEDAVDYLYPTSGSNNYSVGFFFKVDGDFKVGERRVILHSGYIATDTNRQNCNLQIGADGHLYLFLAGNNGKNTIQTNFTTDVWHHIEITWDGTNAVCYYDGNTINLTVGTNSPQRYNEIGFGAGTWNEDFNSAWTAPTRMNISNVYFYNRSRTSTEALASYNSGQGLDYVSEDPTNLIAYYKCHQRPTLGSGNLVVHNMAFTTTGKNAKVFDIWDSDGSHALEMITVNFEGCNQIGYIDGYRQGTGITIGYYGCQDGMYFSGNQNGFKLTNTNGFGMGPDTIMFRRWGNLTFNNRFYLEINVDIPSTGAITDFAPENFNENQLLQINTTLAKVDGVINPPTNTPILFPNISPADPKSLFVGNIGIVDSAIHPYGIELIELQIHNNDSDAMSAGLNDGDAYINGVTGTVKRIGVGDSSNAGGSNFDNYDHWDLTINGIDGLPINSGEAVNFVNGDNVTITRENNDIIFSATNNYIKGVIGDGNSSLTIEREGLSNIVHDLSHNHDGVYATESRVDAIEEDKNYVHTQSTPSTQWVINHNMNKFPNVAIIDENNNTIWTEVVYNDLNTITINFNSAMSGTVTLN